MKYSFQFDTAPNVRCQYFQLKLSLILALNLSFFSTNKVNAKAFLIDEIEISENTIGGGQGIMIDRKEGILIGGSDSRKDGLAIGY